MISDFDLAFLSRLSTDTGVTTVFMPDQLFERRRIKDKLAQRATFSFVSFWRDSLKFDVTRWVPAQMWERRVGWYEINDRFNACMYRLIPVRLPYQIILWETENRTLMERKSSFMSALLRDPSITVTDSETQHLDMDCYLDYQDATFSLQYITEKNDKTSYYRGEVSIELACWIYDYQYNVPLIEHVNMLYYNIEGNNIIAEQWIPENTSGMSGN